MAFTIVIDNDLHFSIIELAAILDLEHKSEEHYYQPLFQKLLDENNSAEIINQLLQVQPFFLRKFSKKSFEPTVNLYIHIINLIEDENDKNNLLSNLISNIDPNSSNNSDIENLEIPSELLIISLTNIFNSLPVSSTSRFECLFSITNIIKKDNILGTISNIAKNFESWVSQIENVSIDKISEVACFIFVQYYSEDELKSINFMKNLINNNKFQLNSEVLITFFTYILNSNSLYDISSLKSKFESINDSNLVKLLNLYILGDYKNFIISKSEFENHFADKINFALLTSSFKSLSILNYLANSNSNSNVFPYSTISNELNIPIDEIELKLIDLISENLIVAKLSQSTSCLILNSINYSAPSLSSNTDLINWNEINNLLESWNENISNLQSIVQNLISKRGKRVNAPPVIMAFHQQKLEAKEAREKKAQQDQTDVADSTTTASESPIAEIDTASN